MDNRRSSWWLTLAGVATFAIVSTALGSEFDNPPETNAPEWETPFPYQRNIDWDFSQDPRYYSPHYEGYDDDELWSSDYVEFTGDVTWYASSLGYDGVIGIDNTGGAVPLAGTVVFHIDNWDDPQLVKHIWDEAEFMEGGDADIWEAAPILPPGHVVVDTWLSDSNQISTDPELWQDNWYCKIEPNPPWEEKVIAFDVPAGDFAFVDRFHIATECVPEPVTLSLFALGGLLVTRRRR